MADVIAINGYTVCEQLKIYHFNEIKEMLVFVGGNIHDLSSYHTFFTDF